MGFELTTLKKNYIFPYFLHNTNYYQWHRLVGWLEAPS